LGLGVELLELDHGDIDSRVEERYDFSSLGVGVEVIFRIWSAERSSRPVVKCWPDQIEEAQARDVCEDELDPGTPRGSLCRYRDANVKAILSS
jgi:hypothetical protein